jgi:hypothetical protein
LIEYEKNNNFSINVIEKIQDLKVY